MSPLRAAGVDAACVAVFVALGRGSHHEGSALGGTLSVAAPFLVALAIGWLLATRWPGPARSWPDPLSRRIGVFLWAVTLLVGMLARRFLWHRGTASGFVVVAALFLATFLIGWRELVRTLLRRRRARAPRSAPFTVE